MGLEAGAAAPHPARLRVPRQDCNTSLVRACWNELFTLGLAQCAQVMSLSTILAADEILVVKDGRIVEKGRHGDLVKAGGVYTELYETQFKKALAAAGEP